MLLKNQFPFCYKLCPVETKSRKWKTFTLHHMRALMSITIPSMYILPSLHQGDCFDLTAATRYVALPYMVAECHCPSTAGQRG